MSDLEAFYVDIHCVDLVEIVTDYLDGALSPEDLERFDHHVEDCEACSVYIDQIKMTVTLVGDRSATQSERGGSDADRPSIELPGNFDELLTLFTERQA